MPFSCSICEQESTKICAFCTKDSCDNHLCQRCGCCSDCCECDLPLDEATAHLHTAPPVRPQPAVVPPEPVIVQEPTFRLTIDSGSDAVTPDPAIVQEPTPAPEIQAPVAEAPPVEPLDIDEV